MSTAGSESPPCAGASSTSATMLGQTVSQWAYANVTSTACRGTPPASPPRPIDPSAGGRPARRAGASTARRCPRRRPRTARSPAVRTRTPAPQMPADHQRRDGADRDLPGTRVTRRPIPPSSSRRQTTASRAIIPSGCPMSRIQPPASGSPSGVVPKQTSRVRTIQSGVAGPTGQSASAHQDAVMTRIAARAATAIRAARGLAHPILQRNDRIFQLTKK